MMHDTAIDASGSALKASLLNIADTALVLTSSALTASVTATRSTAGGTEDTVFENGVRRVFRSGTSLDVGFITLRAIFQNLICTALLPSSWELAAPVTTACPTACRAAHLGRTDRERCSRSMWNKV